MYKLDERRKDVLGRKFTNKDDSEMGQLERYWHPNESFLHFLRGIHLIDHHFLYRKKADKGGKKEKLSIKEEPEKVIHLLCSTY